MPAHRLWAYFDIGENGEPSGIAHIFIMTFFLKGCGFSRTVLSQLGMLALASEGLAVSSASIYGSRVNPDAQGGADAVFPVLVRRKKLLIHSLGTLRPKRCFDTSRGPYRPQY